MQDRERCLRLPKLAGDVRRDRDVGHIIRYYDGMECVHLLLLLSTLVHTQLRERSSLVCDEKA